jgi:hypothetical protein
MNHREKRLALNEAMFREINERLEAQLPPDGNNYLSILCECADPDCTTRIEITPHEYQAARADPRQFILVPGHELVEVEEVMNHGQRYEIVRKHGRAGAIAAQTATST